MITDEMIMVAAAAAWRKDYPQGGSIYKDYESTPYLDKYLYEQDVRIILNAAHPLIRKQVLEEAAGVCEEKSIIAQSCGYFVSAEQCAQAIRNLAGSSMEGYLLQDASWLRYRVDAEEISTMEKEMNIKECETCGARHYNFGTECKKCQDYAKEQEERKQQKAREMRYGKPSDFI